MSGKSRAGTIVKAFFTSGGMVTGFVAGSVFVSVVLISIVGHGCCQAGMLAIPGTLFGGPIGIFIGGLLGYGLGDWVINNI